MHAIFCLCVFAFMLHSELLFKQFLTLKLWSTGDDALPNGLDVTFEVTEMKRVTGSYNTMVGNNEGSMVGDTTHYLIKKSTYFNRHLSCLYI